MLVELVESDLRHALALQVDLEPHAGPVGEVADVRDLGQHLVVDERGHLGDHALVAAFLDAERKLGDDDRGPAAAKLLHVRAGAHDDPAATRPVRVLDAASADDDRTGREVRALDVLREPLDVDVRVVDHRDDPVHDLGEIVRRDVRRHADRDPGRAVDEQVREARREDGRFLPRLVVVRDEVDGVRVDVPQHLGGEAREPALGVAHRRGRITVDVPEVALAVDERIAHRERLGETDEGVVDRLVAVRVVGAHDVADDARALLVRAVRLHAGLVHPEEDTPVHRLQAVAHVGERTRDDDAHRVVEEARAHLLLELASLDAARAQRFDARHRGISRHGRSAR